MNPLFLLRLLVISLLLQAPVRAQDQSELLFDNAETFMNAGKHNEAVADFEKVISDHPDSIWAPRALLSLGRYYLDTQGDHDKALTYFGRIQESYPTSVEAPAAYYYKAVIMEQHGETTADLETAVADLIRMNNLYPESEWRAGAQFLFGKLQFRLGDYDQALSFFQRLEFSYPNSPNLPEAMLYSARAAYLKGSPTHASAILARLQSKLDDSPNAALAAAYLRLLSRFSAQQVAFQSDRTFFGSTPKRYSAPAELLLDRNGLLGLRDSKGVYLSNLAGETQKNLGEKDFNEFALDRNGQLLLVYKNRVVNETGVSVAAPGSVREIRSAAFDEFGRFYLIDGGVRDLVSFNTDGAPIKTFGLNRPRLVRSFGSHIYVLEDSASSFKRFDSEQNAVEHPYPALKNIIDFRFDAFGNLYALYEKGAQVSIYDPRGQLRFTANLKGGAFPLKQAQCIAVDNSGAIYLSDKRGGAVVRFH